jgi:hypothetical protein
MKILERQKPFYSLNAFNDALFVNSTTGLVPPARKRADRRGAASLRRFEDFVPRRENESSNERRTILRPSDFSSRPAAETKFRNLFSLRKL